MRKAGLTQRALAEGLDPMVHRNTIGRWLKPGAHEGPDFVQLLDMTKILGCAGRWLTGASDDPTPPSYLTAQEGEWLELLRGMRPVEREALLEAAREAKGLGERV